MCMSEREGGSENGAKRGKGNVVERLKRGRDVCAHMNE